MLPLLKRWLAHPLTRGKNLDDPATTSLRRQIVRSNPFLRRIYDEWYRFIVAQLPHIDGAVLELGSGAGFLDECLPGLITSDIIPVQGVRLALDAHRLPFADASLSAIVMTDVLHHLANLPRFLAESSRCLKSGGRIIMIEPWVTPWSTFVYSRLHHEPFNPAATDWEFPTSGPVSGANIALPSLAFRRDLSRLQRDFPMLKVRTARPILPFCYLLSGGVSLRPLMPAWSFAIVRLMEQCLRPWMETWGMFAQIVVERA